MRRFLLDWLSCMVFLGLCMGGPLLGYYVFTLTDAVWLGAVVGVAGVAAGSAYLNALL